MILLKQESNWKELSKEIKNKFPIVIGIGGKARSGKDTAGEYLKVKECLTKIAFADILKNLCMKLFDLNYDQVYGDLKEVKIEKFNKSPREILQWFGTDVLRNFYSDVWIEALIHDLHYNMYEYSERGYGLIVTDVRFKNEVDFIHSLGGYYIRIDRPNNTSSIKTSNHISETELNDIPADYIITNDSSIEELYYNIDKMIELLYPNNIEGEI